MLVSNTEWMRSFYCTAPQNKVIWFWRYINMHYYIYIEGSHSIRSLLAEGLWTVKNTLHIKLKQLIDNFPQHLKFSIKTVTYHSLEFGLNKLKKLNQIDQSVWTLYMTCIQNQLYLKYTVRYCLYVWWTGMTGEGWSPSATILEREINHEFILNVCPQTNK